MTPARLLAAGFSPEPVSGLRPGGVFGSYTLIAEVGRGAMGVVFTAQQSGSNRVVAIKFAHGSLAGSPEAMQRFRTEAEAVAALDHPGILPIYEVGEIEGAAYYTMRFVEAGSLAERLEWFADQRREAAALVARIAEAVQHAHERGILHRDLKPGNILLASRTEPLVSDFGLARWLQRESDVTASLAVLGTPDYLAPEMLGGARAGSTTTADVFSLGAILYHLLAGRPPFAGASVAEVLRQVQECAPPPLRGLPRDLAAVCFKCLEREPSARYASAGALAADLRAWLAGQPVVARPVSPVGRLGRWIRRKPVLAGLAFALCAAVVALGANIVVSRNTTLAIEQHRAEIAERFAREQNRTALLARAQLRLRTPDTGRRSESLRWLREAWRLGPSVEIRNAAIAALALPDAEEKTLPPGLPFAEPPAAPEFDISLPSPIVARAFHPSSGRLAAAAKDKLVYLVDVQRRAIVRRLRGLGGTCRALSFSPDGHWLASVADDGTLRLWSVRDGKELLVVSRDLYAKDPQLRWSADGHWLALAAGRAFRISAPEVARFFLPEAAENRAEEVCTIDVSADGRWVVTVDEAGTRLWDARTQRDVALFAKTGAEWSAARFSPDSRRLWIGGWNSALRVVDLPTAENTAMTGPARIADFAGSLIEQSEDGAWLTALSNDGGGFQFVASTAPHRVAWLRHRHPMSLALTRDARRAATSSYDSADVRIWDFPSAKLLRELPIEPPAQLAFTPDGVTLATGRQHTTTLWNTTTGERRHMLPAVARINSLAFSPDGHLLAIETRDGIVLFRATKPFDELARLTTIPDRGSSSFRFSRDSRQLAVQTTAGGAVVWQLDALQRELTAIGMAWDRPIPVTKDE